MIDYGDHLLPPNSTGMERGAAGACSRLSAVPVPVDLLWRPQDCPASHLPWLAWALSVDEWDDAWPEHTKRDVVQKSIDLHRRKGTPWAVRNALVAMGYNHVEILEGSTYRFDATYSYDGAITYGEDLGPYEFDVLLNAGSIPTTEEQVEIERRIGYYKNARSHLRSLVAFELFYNGAASYDGAKKYNGGIVSG